MSFRVESLRNVTSRSQPAGGALASRIERPSADVKMRDCGSGVYICCTWARSCCTCAGACVKVLSQYLHLFVCVAVSKGQDSKAASRGTKTLYTQGAGMFTRTHAHAHRHTCLTHAHTYTQRHTLDSYYHVHTYIYSSFAEIWLFVGVSPHHTC